MMTCQSTEDFHQLVSNEEEKDHEGNLVGGPLKTSRASPMTNDINSNEYTPILRGYFVLGPDPFMFLIHMFLLSFLGGVWGFQYTMVCTMFGQGLFIYISILCGLSFVLFLLTCTKDPGVEPKDHGGGEAFPGSKYCPECRTHRPTRSYHCSHCNICIRKKDMHFWMGGICIGERNMREFTLMTLFFLLLGLSLVLTNLWLLTFEVFGEKNQKVEIYKRRDFYLQVASLSGGLGLLLLPQTGLLMFYIRLFLIAKGLTYFEYKTLGSRSLLVAIQGNRGFISNLVKLMTSPGVGRSHFVGRKHKDQKDVQINGRKQGVDSFEMYEAEEEEEEKVDFIDERNLRMNQPYKSLDLAPPGSRRYFTLVEDDGEGNHDDSEVICWERKFSLQGGSNPAQSQRNPPDENQNLAPDPSKPDRISNLMPITPN